ncbi:MAG: putative RNA helicase [Phylliscum demangeonii]|nr:MAG: putative RNA helicase [Phylliscum demangeonii]
MARPGRASRADPVASETAWAGPSDDSDRNGDVEVGVLAGEASGKRRKRSPHADRCSKGNAAATSRVAIGRVPRLSSKGWTTTGDRRPVTAVTAETATTATTTATDFTSLGVQPWLVRTLASMAIRRPTAIQRACIPPILAGRDCIGGSRTGTGKTVAFAIPIIQRWAVDPQAVFALVLTPTRELALQMYEQFKALSAAQSLKLALITGGGDMGEQALALGRRPHVVIATPGRLADHIRTSGHDTICGLRRVRIVVLDEADRLLAGGHGGKRVDDDHDDHDDGSMLPAVEECLSAVPGPAERQTLLFTATVTAEVRAVKERAGRASVAVCEVDDVDDNTGSPSRSSPSSPPAAIPDTLTQSYLKTPVTQRESYLHILLLTPAHASLPTIVFCNRTSTARLVTQVLRRLAHRVTALHSGLRQRERVDNLGRFRARAARILVATDVAARGLDLAHVALVVNYDVPRHPDDYIHRVGRTARAGRPGAAVTMLGQRDVLLLLAIEARVGRPLREFAEPGVSVEARVVRDALKVVGDAKRKAAIEIDEGRDADGRRGRGLKRLGAAR